MSFPPSRWTTRKLPQITKFKEVQFFISFSHSAEVVSNKPLLLLFRYVVPVVPQHHPRPHTSRGAWRVNADADVITSIGHSSFASGKALIISNITYINFSVRCLLMWNVGRAPLFLWGNLNQVIILYCTYFLVIYLIWSPLIKV